MEICKDLIKLKNTVVGLGFFDGVHIGHQELVRQVVKTAKSNNLKSVIIAFEKSPAEMFVENIEYLTTNSEKEILMENLGVDYLFELDFNNKISNLSPEEYLQDIVVKHFAPKYIYTGFNHTFGKNKQGTPKLLAEFAEKYKYKYVQIPPVEYKNEPVSSTRIRTLLKNGNIEQTEMMLGRPYSIVGTVQKGRQLGREIGFPTANVLYPEKIVQIPFGVYSVTVEIENELFKGVLNYGIKPTVGENDIPILEVNIFDFGKNIYNKPIRINLLKWIRGERKFNSLEELKMQIEKDLKEC